MTCSFIEDDLLYLGDDKYIRIYLLDTMKQTEYIQTAYEVEKIFKFNKNILVIEKQIGCLQIISHNKISKT